MDFDGYRSVDVTFQGVDKREDSTEWHRGAMNKISKVAIIRNPFDLLVSLYHHDNKDDRARVNPKFLKEIPESQIGILY